MVKFTVQPIGLIRFISNVHRVDMFTEDYTECTYKFCERFNCTRDGIIYVCSDEDFTVLKLICPHIIREVLS